MTTNRAIFIAASALAATACASNHSDDGHQQTGQEGEVIACDGSEDAYTAERTGQAGNLAVSLVEARPDPHIGSDEARNYLRVQVTDGDGAAMSDVEFTTVEPWTLSHDGHGTPLEPVVTPVGMDGLYEIDDLNYLHAGKWELRLSLAAGGVTDDVTFELCIAEDPSAVPDAGTGGGGLPDDPPGGGGW